MLMERKESELSFTGFCAEDFAVFELPDFGKRMPALKARITPKLRELGDDLAPRLSEAYGQTLYPHVAQHLRRSVNPPVSTWVAFAKERRAYKPYVHLRAAITADDVRLVVFVEDYADEKERFASNLASLAGPIGVWLADHPRIEAQTIRNKAGEPLGGRELKRTVLKAFGERLARVKGQHAVFGIKWNRSEPVVSHGAALADALVEASLALRPLYLLGEKRAVAAAALKS